MVQNRRGRACEEVSCRRGRGGGKESATNWKEENRVCKTRAYGDTFTQKMSEKLDFF
jgi:hypothetical protein